MKFQCIYLSIFITLLFLSKVQSIFYEECDGEEFGSSVRSSESCQSYLICQGEDSEKLSCDAGEYFDVETQTCDLEENVFCPLDEEEQEEESEDGEEGGNDDEYDENEKEDEADENGNDGNNNNNTNNTTISTNNNSTATNETTTTFNPLVIAPIVKDVCPNIDDPNAIVMMQNNQSCSDYYLCYHGQAIQMHCTDSLHFNKLTGKCDYPEKANCMLDRPNALTCLPNTTALFPHPDKCNYFYYCIKGFLTIQHCPYYYGWDIEKRSCVRMSDAKCHKTARKT